MKGFHTNFERILSILISWAGFAFLFLGVGVNAQELNVLWDRVGDGDSSYFGQGVYPLGDQNDDGFNDWAVFSLGRGPAGQPSERRTSFFLGGSSPGTEPYLVMTRAPNALNEPAGIEITGDLNGDHFKDWYRIARYVSSPESTTIDVFWGGPSWDDEPDVSIRIPWESTYVVPHRGESFDFNGDGYDDLMIYLTIQNGDQTYMFFGGEQMDSDPDLIFPSDPPGSQSTAPLAWGDINGDGYSDLLTNRAAVDSSFVFMGDDPPDAISDIGWADFPISRIPVMCDMNSDGYDDLIVPRWSNMEVTFGRQFPVYVVDYILNFTACGGGSTRMAPAGDFNGDAYGDFIAISEDCVSGYGALSLYLGGAWLNPSPVLTISGLAQPLELRGIRTAAGLGDINGDGVDDFAIGAAVDQTGGRRGRVAIISGDTTYHVGVEHEIPVMPNEFALSVFPNPVNSAATVNLQVPNGHYAAEITLYNTLGQEVFHNRETVSPGTNQVSLSVAELSSGVYFLKAECGNAIQLRKMVVMK